MPCNTMYGMEKMTLLSIRIPQSLRRDLKKRARQQGRGLSAQVRWELQDVFTVKAGERFKI